MKEKLELIREMTKQQIQTIKNLQELGVLKAKVLGKKSELTEILKGMIPCRPSGHTCFHRNQCVFLLF